MHFIAFGLFYLPLTDRKREWIPNICLSLSITGPRAVHLLESVSSHSSLLPLHLCPLMKADALLPPQREAIPHPGPVAQEGKQLCCVLAR